MNQPEIYDYDVILGIDIGLSGGISVFDTVSGEVVALYEMPTKQLNKNGKEKKVIDFDKVKHILETPKVHEESALVVFEDVHVFPFQGSVSSGVLMHQKGFFQGLLRGLGYVEMLVQPRAWQKHFQIVPPADLKGANAKKTKALRKKWLKEESLKVAKSTFPEWEEKIGTKDGLSDCLLIGKYAYSTYNNSPD